MDESLSALADVLFEFRYHSRRQAKRLLKAAGVDDAATALDSLLRLIESHPQREEIERLALAKHEAEQAALAQRLSGTEEHATNPAWLFAETKDGARQFLVHTCPGGAWSFVGEIFDERDDSPDEMEGYPLADGQWLSNILWLDEQPGTHARKLLIESARRELAEHDALLGLESEDE